MTCRKISEKAMQREQHMITGLGRRGGGRSRMTGNDYLRKIQMKVRLKSCTCV
jgi:hypothetical protein